MATAEFERSKAYLQKANSQGVSLYDHLTNVFLSIGKEKPANPIESFEALSKQVKNGTLSLPQYKELPPFQQDAEDRSATISAANATAELLQSMKDAKAPAPDTNPPVVPDLLAHSEMFEWAGVNLGRDVYYKLMCSMNSLLDQQASKIPAAPLSEIRFVGKIFGLQADYYVVEAKFVQAPEIKFNEEDHVEPPGQGSNEYVYFVTNHPESKQWTQLPWVTPAMIQKSRQMRRYFTGDLEAPILGFPRFPWGEAAYLRAQIARIVACTTVSPKGYYAAEEDDGDTLSPLTISDEFEPLPVAELKTTESWAHHRRFILNSQGRVTQFSDEKDGDDDDNDDDKEEPVPFLNGINEDVVKKMKKLWIFRVAPRPPHAVVSVQSLLWPGAVACAKNGGKRWATIYVGFGHKYLPGVFTPPPPPTIQAEFKPVIDEDDDENPVNPILEQVDPEPKPDKQDSDDDDGSDDDS